MANGSAKGSAISAVNAVARAAAGAIWISGWRRTRTVATAKLAAMAIASRSPITLPRAYEFHTITTVPASAMAIVTQVRRATRSPSQIQPSRPAT